MNEPVRQSVPRQPSQLEQIKAALADAEKRLIGGINPTNDLAIKAQNKIISQYKRQIADLEENLWLEI